MVDKNLFLYDLAVVAIFKDEGRYLKEWLDYHLLAGVEHFYLYNNDSTDDYAEVLAPYVEKNLVTLTDWPGKLMMYPAYNDAIEKHRFECRYMAFIDLDEFIFPKSNRPVVEVIDEILSHDSNAAALGINWQCFGSNGHEKADYSRGVLEIFTRHAKSNQIFLDEDGNKIGSVLVKTIANPRCIAHILNPHFDFYVDGKYTVNSDGGQILFAINEPPLANKIVINHYIVKSLEEFLLKQNKGRADCNYVLENTYFHCYDRNEVFDEGILKYRAARAENFSFESDEHRANRVINILVQTLTQPLPADDDREFFVDKLETFLTCRAVAEKFQIKIGDRSAEEIALAWIYRTMIKADPIKRSEIEMFLKALPEILSRPFPICKEILQLTQDNIIPRFQEHLKNCKEVVMINELLTYFQWHYVQKFLRFIK